MDMTYLVVGLMAIVIVIFLCRSLTCWYFKLTLISTQLKKIVDLLEQKKNDL